MTSSSLLLSLIHLYLTYSMYPLYMFYNIKIHTYVYVKKIWKKELIVLPQKNLKPKCIPNVLNTLTSLWHFWDSFLVFPLHPWYLCCAHITVLFLHWRSLQGFEGCCCCHRTLGENVMKIPFFPHVNFFGSKILGIFKDIFFLNK